VTIGKNVWIGMDVKIIPGVTIGDGAVIGLGTVVSEDVPFGAVVGLPKQRIIKNRDKDHYADLEKRRCYGGVNGKLYRPEE
jgi:acetyltransferase-like isoleucine patch superfamily enzyme